jgi:hypothetical protein
MIWAFGFGFCVGLLPGMYFAWRVFRHGVLDTDDATFAAHYIRCLEARRIHREEAGR